MLVIGFLIFLLLRLLYQYQHESSAILELSVLEPMVSSARKDLRLWKGKTQGGGSRLPEIQPPGIGRI